MSSYDITFCNRDCSNYDCKRNQKRLEGYKYPIAIANFYECKEYREIENE